MNGKNAKNHMDEMQELQLLRLEERGFWITLKTNAVFSAAAALVLGAIFALRAFAVLRKPVSFALAWRIALLMAIGYGVCFGLLELTRAIYKKRRQRLDDTEERGR